MKNRLKIIVEEYDRTIFVEEALYRLVEVHYLLGLKNEAEKYAKLLGYNYQSSTWYEKSYVIFNKNYKNKKLMNIEKNKKSKIISKVKSLFD